MWEWYYSGQWVTLNDENQLIMEKRAETPSLEPLYLVNQVGEIRGRPEENIMHFNIHGEDELIRTFIRQGATLNEHAIFVIIEDRHKKIIPYDTGKLLFPNNRPSINRVQVTIGTEIVVAENGILNKKRDGQLQRVHWKKTDMSKKQFESITKARFQWEFKGSFRWERMRIAVERTISELTDVGKKEILECTFEQFDPELDHTEHGSFQFNDYLVMKGMEELAIQVMENYYNNAPTEWCMFDPLTNMQIERARSAGQPTVSIYVRGHPYVIVFDSGSGASGQPPVVIRPLRYERILTAIEENYGRSRLRLLYTALIELQVDPETFLRAVVQDTDSVNDFIPVEHRERITSLLHIGPVSTAIQEQFPTLLAKYKECDIRLSSVEKLSPKKLEKSIRETLMTGFRVPSIQKKHQFSDIVAHICKQQCWDIGTGTKRCDICMCSDRIVLGGHCGSAQACLKCWVESLHKTAMVCPFCRTKVCEAQLCIVNAPSPTSPTKCCKRKRCSESEYVSADEVLQEIQKDVLYAKFTLQDERPMKKWFTVLMRRGLIKNGQLPPNLQDHKSLVDALHQFKILN